VYGRASHARAPQGRRRRARDEGRGDPSADAGVSARGERVGIRVEVGGGQYFRSILAGAWDEATRTGWKANRAGTAFRYRDPSTRIRLTRARTDPSRLRIVIDRFDDPPGLPAVVSAARVVIFFPPTIPGQCAEALFPASACQVRGAVLSCR
jgi:hypothetical protein